MFHFRERLKAVRKQFNKGQPPISAAYRNWRQHFLRRRLEFTIAIALVAYLSFFVLELILRTMGHSMVDPSWFRMVLVTQGLLFLCLLLIRSHTGRRYTAVLFLGCSWSITLTEQIWSTLHQSALIAVYSWTLVFLAQATLMPVRWPLHFLSQLGVLVYAFVVNPLLGLRDDMGLAFWGPSIWLYLFWFCAICNLSVFLYERLQRAEFHARRELEAEQRKSERLLLNILPEVVAQKLKQEHRTIADSFAEATVLFADIVGFTHLSAQIPPHTTVSLLNTIFSTFDLLADKHGLEKIKTIGDAYMVVGGLPLERPDHMEAIADMALDMLTAIAQFNQSEGQSFSIRVGINTGPVVAGVIGVKKFIYDLWGDTVNVASRMESQGIGDRIQVTEAVYTHLQGKYRFEPRGAISVKGKGEMHTYFLIDKIGAY